MKSRSSFYVTIVVLSIMACGCSKTTLVQEEIIDLPPERIDLMPTGSEMKFMMSFADSWSVSSNAAWIVCSPSSGKEGLAQITVMAGINDVKENRTGLLTFSTKEGVVSSIPVSQEYPYLRMTVADAQGISPVESNVIRYNWNEDSQDHNYSGHSISIESNIDWKLNLEAYGDEDMSDLFQISDISGSGTKTVRLTPFNQNLGKYPHEAWLSLDGYMPDKETKVPESVVPSYEYVVHHNNLRFLINDMADDVDVRFDEFGNGGETLSIDSELPWSIVSPAGWVKAESDFKLNDYLQLSVTRINPTTSERVQDVVLQSEGGAERIIHVHQDPYVFNLTDTLTIANTGATQTIKLESSGPWSLNSKPDWLEVDPISGNGGKGHIETITVTCPSQNFSLKDKVGNLLFKSEDVEIRDATVVDQERYHLDLILLDEEVKSIPTFTTKSYDVWVECDGKWTLSSDQSWVNISPSQGTGSRMVKIGASTANPDLDRDRSAKITLSSVTHKEKGISYNPTTETISQQKFIFELKPITETTLPAVTSKSFVLDIDCSGSWEISKYPSWLVPEAKSGENHRQVGFSVNPYSDTSKDRSDKITIKSKYNNVEKSIDVKQEKLVFNVDKSSINCSPVDEGAIHVRLDCTPEATWTVSGSNWVNIVGSSSGEGGKDLEFSVNDYFDTSNSRSSNVTIKCNETGTTKTIKFNQSRFLFDVTESSFSFTELDNSKKEVHVSCSSGWKIESDSRWISFPAAVQSGSSAQISVSHNTDINDRNGSIRIVSIKGNKSKTISVNQAKYSFDQNAVRQTYEPYLSTPRVLSVPIVCSGSWTVTMPSGDAGRNISVSQTSGSGNGSISISVGSNPLTELRTAVISIISNDNSNLRKDVTISQNAFPFEFKASSSTSDVSKSGTTISCSVTCPSGWRISSDSWIKADKTSGSGNGTVRLTVEKNGSNKQRSGTVTLTSDIGHTSRITITQKK